jgi:hypothetical protein
MDLIFSDQVKYRSHPCGGYRPHIFGVYFVGKQVVGIIQRHKTLGGGFRFDDIPCLPESFSPGRNCPDVWLMVRAMKKR